MDALMNKNGSLEQFSFAVIRWPEPNFSEHRITGKPQKGKLR